MDKNNYKKFDLIISDMCPEFTGNRLYDHNNQLELAGEVFGFSIKMLKKNGILILKVFEGLLLKKFYVSISAST